MATVKNIPTYTLELKFLGSLKFIAGVDEVGLGPLAGPVVSAAVILNPQKIGKYRSKHKWWQGIRDSKVLSPGKREAFVKFIKQNALDFGIGQASAREIDELNIHNAAFLAMRRAVDNLKLEPELLLVDGRFTIPNLLMAQQARVDGDAQVLSIAAASILAKVYRDNLMSKYAKNFPQFGFEKHKGYDTAFHRKKLFRYGPCEIHRMSFETVKNAISERFKKMLE